MVSRLLWDKGVREFVDAAMLVRKARGDVVFTLVGTPDEENPASVSSEQVQSWAADGLVEWWGYREDVADVLACSHVAVLPSYGEGLPKTLLEAAACGRPIVATDVSGCREVVRHGGNGLLVPVQGRSRACASASAVRATSTPSRRSRDSLPLGEWCRAPYRRPGMRPSVRIWKHSASGSGAIAASAKRQSSDISGGSRGCGGNSAPTRGGTTRHWSGTCCCAASQRPPGHTRGYWPHRCACICASSPRAASAPRRWSARFPPPPAGGCASCPDMFPPTISSA